jgi:hypothetical protein
MIIVFSLGLVLVGCVPSAAQSTPVPPNTTDAVVLEMRSYNLKAGTRETFGQLFTQEALPLLVRAKIDVVAYGPSLHDRNSYFLMRAFSTLDTRESAESAFYGSAEWRDGPRAAVLAAIESYTTIVIRVDRATVEGLRRNMQTHALSSDLDARVRLNDDYIESVKRSDVSAFARSSPRTFSAPCQMDRFASPRIGSPDGITTDDVNE